MGTEIGQVSQNHTQSDLKQQGLNVVNISATFNIEGEFDRIQLHEDLPNTKYKPDKHRSLIYYGDHAVVLLPPTGRGSIVGATTVHEVRRGTCEFVSELERIGVNRGHSDIKVENIVGTTTVNEELNLNTVVMSLGFQETEYEPEQFPGVIYRSPNNNVVLIFSSGKLVITKVETYTELLSAQANVKKRLPDDQLS